MILDHLRGFTRLRREEGDRERFVLFPPEPRLVDFTSLDFVTGLRLRIRLRIFRGIFWTPVSSTPSHFSRTVVSGPLSLSKRLGLEVVSWFRCVWAGMSSILSKRVGRTTSFIDTVEEVFISVSEKMIKEFGTGSIYRLNPTTEIEPAAYKSL